MKKPIKHQESTEAEPESAPGSTPARHRRERGEPKLFISYLPDGKGGPREEKGSVPLEVDVEAHIEERTDCEPGIYRIEKKRGGGFTGEVMFYTKEPLSRLRNVGRSVSSESDGEDDTDDLNSTETELPGDRLLRSLEGKDDGGRVVVIAKRKADPAGMSFRLPCSTDCTMGEVPYDDADPSVDALELSIQKLYGGGRYEIIVRQDGEEIGSAMRTIADPIDVRREREDGPSHPVRVVPAPVMPMPPAKSSVDELKASVSAFKEVAAVLNNMRQPEPARERETPLETVKNAISLVKDLNTYLPHNSEGSGDGGGSTVREVLDGIASIGREFGLGQVLNNVVMFGLHTAAQKRAGEASQPPAASQQTTGAAGNIGVPAAAEANTIPPAVSPAAPVLSVPEPIGTTADTRGAVVGGFSLELLPPPMRVALDSALSVFVSEMQRSELSDEHETEKAELALRQFVEAFPQGYMVLDYFMQQSSARVLMYLSSFKPEWASVIDLKSAPGFIEVVQEEWAAAKTPDAFMTERVETEERLDEERAN